MLTSRTVMTTGTLHSLHKVNGFKQTNKSNSHPQDKNMRGSHALSASLAPFETRIVRPTDNDAVHIRLPSTPK